MPNRFKDAQLNMDILAEEAIEVAKVVSKIRRFGLDDFHPANGKANRAMLAEEIGHFMFMVETLNAGGIITEGAIEAGMDDKAKKLPEWYRGWMTPPEHECCGNCGPAIPGVEDVFDPAPLSKRGHNWIKFSEQVRDWMMAPTASPFAAPYPGLVQARLAAEKGDYLRAAYSVYCAHGVPGNGWSEFSDTVLRHIEEYTVPQYGDEGDDRASEYTVAACLEHLNRYIDRHGRNSRPGQDELDFVKMAHYISLASEAATQFPQLPIRTGLASGLPCELTTCEFNCEGRICKYAECQQPSVNTSRPRVSK